jgi:hypothetical protein
MVSVFFDLEKHTTPRSKVHKVGLRGRLPVSIAGFLQNRHYRVRIGSCVSIAFNQEIRVPQSCILSVTLFPLQKNLVALSNASQPIFVVHSMLTILSSTTNRL